MTAIGFDPASGSIVIVGNGVYGAGTLTAALRPNGYIEIVSLARRGEQYALWSDVTDLAGSGFGSADAVMAYLEGVFAIRRPIAESYRIATVAGADLIEGLPVTISRSTGKLMPARADTYTLAFVAGLATLDTTSGFATQPVRGIVTLSDWTRVTGQAGLSAGVPYFLAPAGGLAMSPFAASARCVARIGFAASSTSLVVDPTDPVQL